MILTKKQMTEEDIKLQFITPAITATWKLSQITMETKIHAQTRFQRGDGSKGGLSSMISSSCCSSNNLFSSIDERRIAANKMNFPRLRNGKL